MLRHGREISHRHCTDPGESGNSVYTLYDMEGESQDVIVCPVHGESMPLVDDDRVKARPADAGLECEFSCGTSCAGRPWVGACRG